MVGSSGGRKSSSHRKGGNNDLSKRLVSSSSNASSSQEEVIIQLLAKRSCHLPGNTWTQDWYQWFQNSHIIFGICFHHKLHPLETWERCIALVGSISFGCLASNIANMFDMRYADIADDALWEVPVTIPFLEDDKFVITKGLLVLWTIGSICHSVWDFCVWHIMACACCHPGGRWGKKPNSEKFKDAGSYALIPITVIVVGLAVVTTLVRASWEEEMEEAETQQNQNDYDIYSDVVDTEYNAQQFTFLQEYGIELGLAWFVYFPLIGTLIFSGVLGCGRLPILGGRPRDYRLVEQASKGEGAWYMLWGGSPPNISIPMSNIRNSNRVSV